MYASAFAAHDKSFNGEGFQAHRGVGVQARGGNTDLTAQGQLATIGESATKR